MPGFVYFETKVNKDCYWSKIQNFGANIFKNLYRTSAGIEISRFIASSTYDSLIWKTTKPLSQKLLMSIPYISFFSNKPQGKQYKSHRYRYYFLYNVHSHYYAISHDSWNCNGQKTMWIYIQKVLAQCCFCTGWVLN